MRPGRSVLRSQTGSNVGKSAVACVLNARGAKLHVSRAKRPCYSNGSQCSPRRSQQCAHMLQPGTTRLLCCRWKRVQRAPSETTEAVFSCCCRSGAPRLPIHRLSKAFFLSFFFFALLPMQIRADANPSGSQRSATGPLGHTEPRFSQPPEQAAQPVIQPHSEGNGAWLGDMSPTPRRDRGGFQCRTRKCWDERSRAGGEDLQLLLLHFNFSASLNIWPEPPHPPTRVPQLGPNEHAEDSFDQRDLCKL